MKKKSMLCAVLLIILLVAVPGLFAREGANGRTIAAVKNSTVNGHIALSVRSGTTYEPIGKAEYGIGYSSGLITLPEGMANLPELFLRIEAVGKGISHIDSLFLPGFAIADDDTLKAKLDRTDHDVLEIGAGHDIRFLRDINSTQANRGKAAEIVARIEPEKVSTMPLRFPQANTYRGDPRRGAFYSYEVGSVPGSLTLNGELTDETLGKPFFDAYVPIGSGHPQRNVMTWVRDDGKNLYVAVDFLPDNTFDGEVDYAALYIDTPDGVKRFRSSVGDTAWGVPGFTYTDKVDYQHKVYEFMIPFAEIGAGDSASERIRLSFEAYGTVAASLGTNATDISYNSIQNEYLITYQAFELTSSDDINIQAEILDQDGNQVGSPEVIASGIDQGSGFPDHFVPDVSIATAYSSGSNCYLVVWADDSDNNDNAEISGRILDADGVPVGFEIPINLAIYDVFEPDVAYDPVRDRFLVVWTANQAGPDLVYGVFVETDGDVGSSFAVCNNFDGDSGGPAIAFDDINDRYLVAFIDNRDVQYDLYGQLFGGDGTPVTATDTNFRILSRTSWDMNPPSISFDRVNQRYMVAADDVGIGSVLARLLDKDGNLFDHDGNSTPEEVDDFVALNDDGERTAVAFNPGAYNSGSGEYGSHLIAWQRAIDDDTDFELIEGAYLDVDAGNKSATATLVHNETTYIGDRSPALAANPYAGNFLLAYHEYNWNSEGYEVKVIANTAPAPNPGLAWPAGQNDGVTPDSGASGSTFTFEVEYVSNSNTAPTIHELWIDLDGDGIYSEDVALSPLTGPRPSPPRGEAFFTLFALLVGLSLLPAARTLRKQAPLWRTVGAVIVAAVVLTGCPVPNGGPDAASPAVIDIAAIPGVIAPAYGETPVTTITETAQYTGTVSWSPADSPFGAETVYTATITLTAKTGYTLTGVSEDFFTVAGVTSVTNASDSGVVTAEFPATGDIIDPPVEAVERITMEEVDSGDTNYADGKMYSVAVAVTSEVSDVSYRFVFSDGTREAEAYGASEMWFTVTQ